VSSGARIFDEVEVGVSVEEILRDRRIRAGFDLALEVGRSSTHHLAVNTSGLTA
jgi:hypothetical protein